MSNPNSVQQGGFPSDQTANTTQTFQQNTGSWPAGTEAQQQQWAAAWANYGYNQQMTPEQYQQYYQYYQYYGYWPQQYQQQQQQTTQYTGTGATAASYANNYPTIQQSQQLDEAKRRLEAQKRAAGLLPQQSKPNNNANSAGLGDDFQTKVQQASSLAQQLSKSQQKKLKRQQIQQQQKQQQSSINWTPDVRAYVERSFATCETDEEKGQMELVLRDAIKQAITEGNLNTKDWLKEPVPILFVIYSNHILCCAIASYSTIMTILG
eukprot:TRINITY_DN911_c0_g1_i4.p2 TRINITY_DN911_c0_g1~~TRINITY_DN911_c0_g1_i4.p2  ORF type:complete len:265 (-),score=67.35 TRINITY_DN911_c0_g1_i4:1079-1873(-)